MLPLIHLRFPYHKPSLDRAAWEGRMITNSPAVASLLINLQFVLVDVEFFQYCIPVGIPQVHVGVIEEQLGVQLLLPLPKLPTRGIKLFFTFLQRKIEDQGHFVKHIPKMTQNEQSLGDDFVFLTTL